MAHAQGHYSRDVWQNCGVAFSYVVPSHQNSMKTGQGLSFLSIKNKEENNLNPSLQKGVFQCSREHDTSFPC